MTKRSEEIADTVSRLIDMYKYMPELRIEKIQKALDQHAKEVEEATIERCAKTIQRHVDNCLDICGGNLQRPIDAQATLYEATRALRNLNKEGK